ncbi:MULTISPECIES: transketolase [Mesoplasma]|uniref:Transketolase n=1 Tax=Mesoplasma florum TaxID=2151 RepID=A0A2R3P7C7_MESFO|nr:MULTISPECIES: transketolase [Mesoplasma]AVN64374.1 transketolase [Mesoplasma florum]
MKTIEQKSIDSIRLLGIEQIVNAKSGHPGMVMSAAPGLHELYMNHLKINVKDPKWINRDRFVLSAGHGSALLYSILYAAGFNIKIEDLKNFRKIHSITPGHPEIDVTEGIDVSTGPLGQGFAMGVGLAIAEKHLSAKYNKKENKIIDHKTYILCGDADLQEGVTQEAIQLAGVMKLNKLIVLYDSNDVQLDTKVNNVQIANYKEWLNSMNWNYIKVEDGFNPEKINSAINLAKTSDKPTLIELKTIIGYGHDNQGTPAMHGNPFSNEDLFKIKSKFEIEQDFDLNEDVKEFWKEKLNLRTDKEYSEWCNQKDKYLINYPDDWKELNNIKDLKLDDFKELLHNEREATRISSFKTLTKMQNLSDHLIGGSADLSAATKVFGIHGDFSNENPLGNNIQFGVREFAMSCISNGIQLHSNLKAFNSTFLVFSDYMKNGIRLSAIQKLPTLYVFTHDSLAVGFDGPTHEPIEQLAGLRATPNLYNFRPADMKETIGAYVYAYNQKKAPSTLNFCRQDVSQLKNTCWEKTQKGAYTVSNNEEDFDIILIATGSEVSLALEVSELLKNDDIIAKVVSMPCMELFDEQDEEYKESIIPSNFENVCIIEAGASFGWHKYSGKKGKLFTVDIFGHSGNGEDVMKTFGFEKESIRLELKKYLKK